MNNRLTMLLAILALIVSIFTIVKSKSNIDPVYVDVNKLIEGYERTKTERKSFETKKTALTATVDSLMANWQTELKAYEKELANMNKKQISDRQQMLQTKQQQINNYKQSVQKQIQEENQKMTQTIINDINDFTKEFGSNHDYKIIFGAMGSGNIMYASEGTDLTESVLEGLNARYRGE